MFKVAAHKLDFFRSKQIDLAFKPAKCYVSFYF